MQWSVHKEPANPPIPKHVKDVSVPSVVLNLHVLNIGIKYQLFLFTHLLVLMKW